MTHNWAKYCIGLFHVSGNFEQFGRVLFVGKKINSLLINYYFLLTPSLRATCHSSPMHTIFYAQSAVTFQGPAELGW